MFQSAVLNTHLSVAKLMLDRGFRPFDHLPLRELLHQTIETFANQDCLQPTIRFLLDAGLEINYQRPADLFTPLHVACTLNLYETAYLLGIYGADVNAIAKVTSYAVYMVIFSEPEYRTG